jgi:hypothetical protein
VKQHKRNQKAVCAFCRKSPRDAGPLIQGPDDVYICAECAELCTTIAREERERRTRGGEPGSSGPTRESVRALLDRLIQNQSTAKDVLIEAAFSDARPGAVGRLVALAGPSAAAKFLLAGAFAEALRRRLVLVNAATLIDCDKGTRLRLLHEILTANDFDVERAARSIVFLANVDEPAAQVAFEQFLVAISAGEFSDRVSFDATQLVILLSLQSPASSERLATRGSDGGQRLATDSSDLPELNAELVARLFAAANVQPADEQTLFRALTHVDRARWLAEAGASSSGSPGP